MPRDAERRARRGALPQTLVDDEIRAGRSVVVNVSRTMIEAARRAYASVVVIAITAPPEVALEEVTNG